MPAEQFTLEQAEDEVGALRGQVTLMGEYQTVGGLTLNGIAGALGTGLITGADGWHSLGALTGCTVNNGRYKLAAADNMLIVDVEVNVSGVNLNPAVFANTLPAAYRPLTNRHLPLSISRAQTAGEPFPRLEVLTTGTVQIRLNAGIAGTPDLGVTAYVPLD